MREKLPNSNSDLEQFRPFNNVDIIVSDIDGTLVAADGTTVGQVKNTIKQLEKENKIYFSIATGRTFSGVVDLLDKLNLRPGIPIALYNGGIIMNYGTTNVISVNVIDRKECLLLLELMQKMNIHTYIYTFYINQEIPCKDNRNRIEETVYGLGEKEEEYDVNGLKIKWIEDLHEIQGQINAILIEEKDIIDDFRTKILDVIQDMENIIYTDSGSGYLELKPKGVDKGAVIGILRKYVRELRRNKNQPINVLTIGDNDNDLELFQNADISVAVANASALAIEETDYICENESAEGFVDMLNAIRTAKKYYGERTEDYV